MIDATEIDPNLYQGREPRHSVDAKDFDALVLCWEEGQPQWPRFSAFAIYHCPLQDDQRTMRSGDEAKAAAAARWIIAKLDEGKRVLVTCMQGMNRSGLVTALTLHHRLGISGREAIKRIRSRRPGALYNPAFVAYLESL